MERRLIEDYVMQTGGLLGGLTAQNHSISVEIAGFPDMVKG